jgi:hypothetical protein
VVTVGLLEVMSCSTWVTVLGGLAAEAGIAAEVRAVAHRASVATTLLATRRAWRGEGCPVVCDEWERCEIMSFLADRRA